MKTFRQRHLAFTVLLLIGLAVWFAATATIGEHYATAVGPDFLIKLPVAAVKLAVILWLSRWVIEHRFPTIYAFTQQGSKPASEFARAWNQPLQNGHDPRLAISIATYLGVHLFVALAVLFAL